MEKINISDKIAKLSAYWSPGIIARLNDHHIKLATVLGDFVWHAHKNSDEMFLVVEGCLTIEFAERSVQLHAGEMMVVPKGVRHRPRATQETRILIIEAAGTLNTGEVDNELTKDQPEWI